MLIIEDFALENQISPSFYPPAADLQYFLSCHFHIPMLRSEEYSWLVSSSFVVF